MCALRGYSYTSCSTQGEVMLNAVNPNFDEELICTNTFEAKLQILFGLKDRWTLDEVDSLIGESLELGEKLANVIARHARQINDVSPLNKQTTLTYYIKKF